MSLSERGFEAGVITEVLDRLERCGLVDDEAFARSWVESRARGRGLARRALRVELARKGVSGDVAERALGLVADEDEAETATVLVRRRLARMGAVPTDVARRRLVSLLARRGFSEGAARQAVAEVLADPERGGEAGDVRTPSGLDGGLTLGTGSE